MTHDRDDRPVADALALARDVRAHAETQTQGLAPQDVAGGFADVVRRAAQLPDTLWCDADIDEAERLGGLSDAALVAGINFGTIEDFLDDASAFVAEQEVHDTPPQRQPATRRGSGRLAAAVAVAVAIAASVILVPWLAGLGWYADGSRAPDRDDHASALDRARLPATDGSARVRAATPERATAKAPVPPPAPIPLAVIPEADAPVAPLEPGAPAKPTLSKDERLAALDAQARAAWKQGNLPAAQQKLEALVRAGGRRSIADIAYGDLFSLSRQQGDDAALRGYWRRYAAAFPKGRYIDDARAGLCRTASPNEQRSCWARYLQDRPGGTYHEHARDVLARPE